MGNDNATGAAAVIGTAAEQQGAIRINSKGQMELKAYFAAGFTQYLPYTIYNTAAAATSPAAITVATEADAMVRVGVPQGTTTTTAGWYWVVIQGVCEALADGTTDIANGAFLEPAATGFVLDHATAATLVMHAIAREAYAADAVAAIEVYLYGNCATIA